MARLIEPPVSTDSLETLRKKLLRQNRDLAKSNNIRALKIRELENQCACMLSENVELRGRVIELEKQVEDSEARRIADHAMAIKAKLEAQLTEWGTLIAGLGLEPPPKRHSPRVSSSSKRRTSFSFNRTSPSQRRLRDVAKDIEELGHISEHKSFSRMSMNPEQILALRSEADSARAGSPELGPPPMSQFIEDDHVNVDSSQASPPKQPEPSPTKTAEPPMVSSTPKSDNGYEPSPSPQKKRDAISRPATTERPAPEDKIQKPQPQNSSASQAPATTPTMAGIKRKLATRDETIVPKPASKTTNENQPPRLMAGKSSIRDKAGGKPLKELSTVRKEERPLSQQSQRKPLSSKNTNDDISSPKKKPKQSTADEVTAAKSELKKTKTIQDRPRLKAKNLKPVTTDVVPEPEPAPAVATVTTSDLGTPLAEPELLAPNSPISAVPPDAPRGDTPPPADISSRGETSRASRRSRGVVSYAEPNLRDKMRRPTKDLVDAVTGSRRSSHFELISHDSTTKSRPGSHSRASETRASGPEPGSIPASPSVGRGPSSQDLPRSVATERKKRSSSAVAKEDPDTSHESTETLPVSEDVDLYEFMPSSPNAGKQGKRKGNNNRQAKSSRRFSEALDNDDPFLPNERSSSRRRSMMV